MLRRIAVRSFPIPEEWGGIMRCSGVQRALRGNGASGQAGGHSLTRRPSVGREEE